MPVIDTSTLHHNNKNICFKNTTVNPLSNFNHFQLKYLQYERELASLKKKTKNESTTLCRPAGNPRLILQVNYLDESLVSFEV